MNTTVQLSEDLLTSAANIVAISSKVHLEGNTVAYYYIQYELKTANWTTKHSTKAAAEQELRALKLRLDSTYTSQGLPSPFKLVLGDALILNTDTTFTFNYADNTIYLSYIGSDGKLVKSRFTNASLAQFNHEASVLLSVPTKLDTVNF